VDFSGGAGLLLLMQADKPISMHSEANTIFIMFPLRGSDVEHEAHSEGPERPCLSSQRGTGSQSHPTFDAAFSKSSNKGRDVGRVRKNR
jgi:hypothetical protein